MKNANLDITLVSGARPALLQQTLESFQKGMFANFDIKNVYANVDLIMGSQDDLNQCVRLIAQHFPEAQISTPEHPSFGQAVKSLWQATGDNVVFHLEDDWLLNQSIFPKDIFPLFQDDVGMVQPAMMLRQDETDDFLIMTKKTKIFGIPIKYEKVNAYGTSPRFFRPGLAKTFGDLIIAEMDPEKQVFKRKNKALEEAHEPYRCRLVWADGGEPLITDIGRDWRQSRQIKKVNRNGYAHWTSGNA
jgi:hypothetical protein